jgi:predicted acetyltransferase
MVTVQREYDIDTVDIAFTDGNNGSCNVERIDHAEAEPVCAALYQEFIADRSVYIDWEARLQKGGGWGGDIASTRFGAHIAVATDGSSTPVGYVIYITRSGNKHKTRTQTLHVSELIWTTMDAYRSLWSFIASHDLVGAVKYHSAPADDPAPELFMEPRLLDTKDNEGMWLRIVDVPAALSSRRYHIAPLELSLAIEIVDDGTGLAEWNNGIWLLSVGSEGEATVAAAEGGVQAEISLTIKAMASLWTGFRTAAELHAWDELAGEASAVTKACLIFAPLHAPHCFDHY